MRRSKIFRLHGVIALLGAALASPSGAASAIESVVQAEYPRILASWARGEEAEAVANLVAFESKLIRPKAAERDVEQLWRAKLRVVRDTMARSSVEILVPIMLLQHDASRRYAEARNGVLARHSEVMSAELADFYAKKSESPSASRVAGDLLSSLAGHLQSGLVMRRSAELFQEALELDPANFAAHMGLASMFERRGELEKAQAGYEAAARVEPESSQALLRQALCAARRGDTALAQLLFDRVLALDGPDWIEKLAYQEKARLFDNPSQGTTMAREARRRFPGGSRQSIQLSFLLERQGQSQQALAALNDLPETAEPESERYLYARWPQEALATTRTRLRKAAQGQNELLARATTSAAGISPTE